MQYEVTVCVPVYNAERYIRKALESALAQTYQNIEFLICDDCGTDGSMDIVRQYQQKHPRGRHIRIVRQPHNMGVGAGRNRMIDEAQGRYLFYMDADDEITPDAIRLLHEAAVAHDADIVYGSYDRVEDMGDTVKHNPCVYPSMLFTEPDDFACYVYRKYEGIQATTWNFLIKAEVYRNNHIRYMQVNFWEDFAVTFDLPTYVNRVVLLPDITYIYYCRFGSLSNFQKRKHIDKEEIQHTIDVMNTVKQNSGRMKDKPYFSHRLYKIMMTHFYIACTILRFRGIVTPAFTQREVRDLMRSPLSFGQTCRLSAWRWRNLVLWMLGQLPPGVSVAIIGRMGKWRHLI